MDAKARYDAACKRLLSEKAILARIMKGCLDTEDKAVREGTVAYDIRFRALVPDADEYRHPLPPDGRTPCRERGRAGSDLTEAEKGRILQSDYGISMTVPMREEMSAMCNLSDGVEARGMEKGLAKGMESTYLASIKNLMKKMSLSADNAISVLEIPETERQKYRDLPVPLLFSGAQAQLFAHCQIEIFPYSISGKINHGVVCRNDNASRGVSDLPLSSFHREAPVSGSPEAVEAGRMGFTGGTPVDFWLHPTAVSGFLRGGQGLHAFVGLVDSFFAMGSFALRGNVPDKRTLQDDFILRSQIMEAV